MTLAQLYGFVVALILGLVLIWGAGFILGRMMGFRKGHRCAYEEYSAMIQGLKYDISYDEIQRRCREIYDKHIGGAL